MIDMLPRSPMKTSEPGLSASIDQTLLLEVTGTLITAAANYNQGRPPRRIMRGLTAMAMMMSLSGEWADAANAAGASVFDKQFQSPVPLTVLTKAAAEVWAELDGYRELDDGWDGPDSLAPSNSAIADAQAFLAALPASSVVPHAMISSDGYVGLFWDNGKNFASVSFSGGGKVSYYGTVQGVTARGTQSATTGFVPADLLGLVTRI
jgi:hypothetical protein